MPDPGSTGGGGGGGGSAGSAANTTQSKVWRVLNCANKLANDRSLAAAFGAQNTFVGKALGGNIFGGIGELVTAVAGKSEFNVVKDGAAVAYGGASLGIPVPGSHPGLNGAGGFVQDTAVKAGTSAVYNAFTGAADAPMSIVTGEAVAGTASQLTAETLEDVASGVGLLKLAYDGVSYIVGAVQCAGN